MYRVELKDKLDINTLKRRKIALFLMYRVELKGPLFLGWRGTIGVHRS